MSLVQQCLQMTQIYFKRGGIMGFSLVLSENNIYLDFESKMEFRSCFIFEDTGENSAGMPLCLFKNIKKIYKGLL